MGEKSMQGVSEDRPCLLQRNHRILAEKMAPVQSCLDLRWSGTIDIEGEKGQGRRFGLATPSSLL